VEDGPSKDGQTFRRAAKSMAIALAEREEINVQNGLEKRLRERKSGCPSANTSAGGK